MTTIYFDTCALNRLTDDSSQARILAEAAAVEAILHWVTAGELRWASSSILKGELARNPNLSQREDSLDLLQLAEIFLTPDAATIRLALHLRAEGVDEFDALHLALAEQGNINILLTTDDRFIRRAARRPPSSPVSVLNPVDWLRGRKPWLVKR